MKLNAALSALPSFTAGRGDEPHRAMVTITPGLDGCQEAFEACQRGEPGIGFAELYFQTAYDPSVAPVGKHVMSVFAHYAPYQLSDGDWDGRRDEIGELILDAIAVHAPDVHDCVEHVQVLGPARHRAPDGPDGRPHLPGRCPARARCGIGASRPELRSMACTCVALRLTREGP